MTREGPPAARSPGGNARARRDAFLLALLYVGLALILWRAHYENVDSPHRLVKLKMHDDVLANRERDPYQYKLWTLAWAVEGVHRATGLDVFDLYAANGLLSLIALLFAHHLWLARLLARDRQEPPTARANSPPTVVLALLGTLLLCALAHGLFLDYYHQPYDWWGVAGFCVLLAAIASGAGIATLCALALATGLVWEKHILLPFVWAVLRRREGDPWRAIVPRAAAFAACAVVIPAAVRFYLGGDRLPVDVTSLPEQDWGKVFWHQLPYVLPFATMLVVAWARVPVLVRWLWAYVPVMLVAYAASRFILYELRSFWAFAPVFTATTVAWVRGFDGEIDATTGMSSPDATR